MFVPPPEDLIAKANAKIAEKMSKKIDLVRGCVGWWVGGCVGGCMCVRKRREPNEQFASSGRAHENCHRCL